MESAQQLFMRRWAVRSERRKFSSRSTILTILSIENLNVIKRYFPDRRMVISNVMAAIWLRYWTLSLLIAYIPLPKRFAPIHKFVLLLLEQFWLGILLLLFFILILANYLTSTMRFRMLRLAHRASLFLLAFRKKAGIDYCDRCVCSPSVSTATIRVFPAWPGAIWA